MPECTLVYASRVEGSKDVAFVSVHARHSDLAQGSEWC